MYKLTIIYYRLNASDEFDEDYYLQQHMPRASAAFAQFGITRMEMEKVIGAPGGRDPDFYRLSHIYADSLDQLQQALISPEGIELGKDLRNFARGRVAFVLSEIQLYR